MTLIEEVQKIQNKAKSLIWGCAESTDRRKVFAVGHKAYPKVVKYFAVEFDYDTFNLSVLHSGVQETLVKKCKSVEEVVSEVIQLLKEWFPAKSIGDSE